MVPHKSTIKISAIDYPSTVYMIDDSMSFLENLRFSLSKQRTVYQLESDPLVACDYLENQYVDQSIVRECVEQYEDSPKQGDKYDFCLPSLYKEVNRPDRFRHISVVVVDQFMPQMTGINFCTKLIDQFNHNHIKVILLTGAVSHDMAVRLLNEGFIHGFVNKEGKGFQKYLDTLIRAKQVQHFNALCAEIDTCLSYKNTRAELRYLYDANFKEFFTQFCNKHNIVEHYLIEGGAGLLLVDYDGQVSILSVRCQEDMDAQIELVETSDTMPQASIVKAINQHEALIFPYLDKNIWNDTKDWELGKELFEVSMIEGNKDKFYYAHIKDSSVINIDTSKVLSLSSYYEKLVEND